MSLIQEALKRQHEENGGAGTPPPLEDKAPILKTKPAAAPEQSSSPPPGVGFSEGQHVTPSATQAGTPATSETHVIAQRPITSVAEAPRSGRPVLIVGIALILLLAFGVGVWLVAGRFTGLHKPAPLPSFAPSIPSPVPTFAPSAPTQAVPQLIQPVPSNAAVAAVLQVPRVESPPVATSTVPAVVPPPIPPAPAVWPILKVNALLKTSKMGSVRLNNSDLLVGDEIDGVRVVDIDSSMVTLQYKGETRKLRTGDVTK